MHALAPLIQDLAIMLGIASVVTLVFQRLHQPVVLGYLVAGIIIGPYTPPHALITSIPEIKVLSELGVIFLMFSLGLDFSFHKLARVGFSASITGLIEVLLMIAIGMTTGLLMHWSFNNSLFLGAALSISSTTIIIKALDELQLKTKRFAEFIFGVLVIEDLFAILLLAALSTVIATHHILSLDMLRAVLQLIFVVGGWFLVGYFLVPTLFRRIARFASQETLTIVSVALCLMLVTIAAYFNYSTALGAFIMGSILAETSVIQRIEKLIGPIRDIFAAVFFISVGMLIDPKVIITYFPLVILISGVTIIGKIVTTSIGAFLTGQSMNTSLRIGFSMAQIGEFSFIIAALGLTLKVTDEKLYPIIVAVSAVTTFTTPYLIKFSGFLGRKLEMDLPENIKYFLNGYTAWVYRARANSKTNVTYQNAIYRVILNGILVAIIFTLTQHLVLPEIALLFHKKWLVRLLGWVIAMILSSPFIWGMLFAFRKKNKQTKKTDFDFFSTPVMICWLVTVIEITTLSVTYFHTWFSTSLLLIIAVALFVLSYRQLETSYHWFESRLVKNVSHQGKKHARLENLAPWDTHFVEIMVSDESILVDKTLKECQLREQFGVNIVAIYRRKAEILTPKGSQIIAARDKLIVLGSDDQIDEFKKIATQAVKEPHHEIKVLENFESRAIVLSADNPMVGESIRDSLVCEKMNGIVVGLERGDEHILNPDLDTVLVAGDLLLVVGELARLRGIHK